MAKQMIYPIGTRVVANSKAHNELVGIPGVVVEHSDGNYGVELDHSYELYLHDCNGKATPRWGWYFKEEELDEEMTSFNCRTSVRNKELTKTIRNNTNFCIGDNNYSTRVNGAVISSFNHEERIAIIANNVLIRVSSKSEEDDTYINHVLDCFKLDETKSVLHQQVIAFTDADIPKEVAPSVEEVVKNPETKKEEPPKVYATEEEMLRDLGIK
jgi:hypothetical protein